MAQQIEQRANGVTVYQISDDPRLKNNIYCERSYCSPDSRYFSQGRPDQDGRFKVVGLPGETYLVAALEYVDSHEWRDPEFLEGLRAAATRVSAADGETKDVTLKLVPPPF